MSSGGSKSTGSRGLGAAWAAFGLGVVYAGFSVLWALGGSWLVDTVGGALQSEARVGGDGLRAVAWGSAFLKVGAAVLGVLVVSGRRALPALLRPWAILLAWTAAAVLTLYGGVLTAVGLLVQAGVIEPAADADRTAVRWHAFLWDPWFLVWGLLLSFALWASRPPKAARKSGRRARR